MIGGVKLRYDVRCERCKTWIARTQRAARYRGRIWHRTCLLSYQRELRERTGEQLHHARPRWQQDRLVDIEG